MRSLEDHRESQERDPPRTNQVQFKDKQTPEIKECTRKDQEERVSEASRAPTLCHMPSECVCSV